MKISQDALIRARSKTRARDRGGENPFIVTKPMPGVVPAGAPMAMDDAFSGPLGWATHGVGGIGGFGAGRDGRFIGYPELSILAQLPEYRRLAETIGTEMTRRWIKVQATGDKDKTDEVQKIEAELKRLNVQDAFRKIAEQDAFFGRAHLYIDIGETDDPAELQTPIGDGRDKTSQAKVAKGSLARLKTVEAVWCYPAGYNSNDPLKANWYRPDEWYVMGKRIHSSRFLTFVGREVPDLLKPAYCFGGLSLSQMAKPYVDNWLRARQSTSDIMNAFSVFVLSTNLTEKLNGNGDEFYRRLEIFNETRDNSGVLAIDKTDEEFANIAAPLGSLDKLQAQAQEHMCSVSGIPQVKLFGISPAGLNASSEGEIRSFYDWIHANQVLLFSVNLNRIMGFIQLNLFGDVDPEITWAFEPLWSLDDEQLADVRKTEAETGAVLIQSRAISIEEERARIAADPETPYASLEVKKVPPLSAVDKSTVAAQTSSAISQMFDSGIIDRPTALKEALNSGKTTGVGLEISKELIAEAEEDPPEPTGLSPEELSAQAKLEAAGAKEKEADDPARAA